MRRSPRLQEGEQSQAAVLLSSTSRHAGQHFELDHLVAPVDAWLLEAELVAADDPVTLPPSLAAAAEVADDPAWRNAALARTEPTRPVAV